jgi:hypothetical protein
MYLRVQMINKILVKFIRELELFMKSQSDKNNKADYLWLFFCQSIIYQVMITNGIVDSEEYYS